MLEKFENKHLAPVFLEILPELTKNGIGVWVFGGVAIAGIKGEFFRCNGDVDVFVKINDFDLAKATIEKICIVYLNWNFIVNSGIKKRPKIEIYEGKNEIFSLVPAFPDKDKVHFLFPNGGSIDFDINILNQVERKIGSFKFITPPDKYVKDLFRNHHNLLLQRHKGEEDKSRHLKNYKIDKEFLDLFIK